MKVQLASDLHLEFQANRDYIASNPLIPVGDVLVLAGDIVPFRLIDKQMDFFQFCADNFENTYWIPGNHEYYHGELSNRTGAFIENIKTNVHLVNNHCAQHENTKIILSTLWTPISNEKAWHIQNGLNDYQLINNNEMNFTTSRSSQLFEENFAFIQEAVENNEYEKCIVVTHHVPTFQHYPDEYKGSILNEAFAVDLDQFIENSSIDYWIYGHHHRNTKNFKIGKTELITNQLGYVHYGEHSNFSLKKLIITKRE